MEDGRWVKLPGETDRAGSDWFLRKLKYESALFGRERGCGRHYYHVSSLLSRAPTGGIQPHVRLAPHQGKHSGVKIRGKPEGLTERGSTEGGPYAGRPAQGEGNVLLAFCLSSLYPRSVSPKLGTCLATLLSLLPVLCGSTGQRLES